MRNFMLGLSFSAVFIVGCLFGANRSSDTVPAVAAAPVGQRYAYYCIDQDDNEYLTKAAKKMGQAGWRLVGGGGGGNSLGKSILWCFEKRF